MKIPALCSKALVARGRYFFASFGRSVFVSVHTSPVRYTKYGISYWGNPDSLLWAMQVGCLIDKDSMAFAYDKVFKDRPIIGCGIILDSQPKLLPMVLSKGGSWNKVVP